MNNYMIVDGENKATGLYIVNSSSKQDAEEMLKKSDISNAKLIRIYFSIEIPLMFNNCVIDDKTITNCISKKWSFKK